MKVLTKRAVVMIAAIWSIGGSPAAAQRCDGVQAEIGSGQQRCLKPGAGEVFRDCPACPEMVAVPARSFTMGAALDEQVATQREDQVRVAIAMPFAVGRFAVTRGEFAAFVAATRHKIDGGCYRLSEQKREVDRNWEAPGFTQHDRHPVVCVNWNDATAYAAWLASLVTALDVEISTFLNQYNESFATFDGNQIAGFYHIPTITVRGDGSIHCFQSREEIARFFQGVVDTYRGEGAQSGTMNDLEVVPIGERSALATVTWKNFRPDGSLTRQWRQSYNAVRVAEGWRILATTFHLSAAPAH